MWMLKSALEPGPMSHQSRPDLGTVLEESIKEGLREVLGQSGLQMVLSLQPLGHISTDPAAFHDAMTSIFMERGATIIEREIARRLLDKLGGESARDGRVHRWRFQTSVSGADAPARASAREKEVLRKFVNLATFPQARTMGHAREPASVEITSMRFASAFKKGV
jgi:hypothetical protein